MGLGLMRYLSAYMDAQIAPLAAGGTRRLRSLQQLYRRLTNAVAWLLVVGMFTAVGILALGVRGFSRETIFIAAALTTLLIGTLAIAWYIRAVLNVDLGEVTLRHVIGLFREGGHQWPDAAQGAVNAILRARLGPALLAVLPLAAATWVATFDPAGQWMSFGIVLGAIVLAMVGYFIPRGTPEQRALVFLVALGLTLWAGFMAREGNPASYQNQAVAAAEAAGEPDWCTHQIPAPEWVGGSQAEGFLQYEILIQPGCAVQYNRPPGTWWDSWSILPANRASWYDVEFLDGDQGVERCGAPLPFQSAVAPSFVIHDGGGVAEFWVWDPTRVSDPTTGHVCRS